MKSVSTVIFTLTLLTHVNAQYLSDFDSTYRKIEQLQARTDLVDEDLAKYHAKYYTKELARKMVVEGLSTTLATTPLKISDDSLLYIFDLTFDGYYPTRYQNPEDYFNMKRFIDSIHRNAQLLKPNSYKPKFGTIDINSTIIESKPYKGEYLILRYRRAADYMDEMITSGIQPYVDRIFNRWPHFDGKDLTASIANSADSTSMIYMLNCLNRHHKYRYGIDTVPLPTKLNVMAYWQYWIYLFNAVSYFEFAHEYSHGYLAHKPVEGYPITDEMNLQSWYQEYAADSLAKKILTFYITTDGQNNIEKNFRKLTSLGDEIFFNCLYAYETTSYILKNDELPPSISVKDSITIRKILEKKFDEKQAIQEFSALPDNIKGQSHPPSLIRLAMLAESTKKIKEMNLAKEKEENDIENGVLAMGESMVNSILTVFYNCIPILIQNNQQVKTR